MDTPAGKTWSYHTAAGRVTRTLFGSPCGWCCAGWCLQPTLHGHRSSCLHRSCQAGGITEAERNLDARFVPHTSLQAKKLLSYTRCIKNLVRSCLQGSAMDWSGGKAGREPSYSHWESVSEKLLCSAGQSSCGWEVRGWQLSGAAASVSILGFSSPALVDWSP